MSIQIAWPENRIVHSLRVRSSTKNLRINRERRANLPAVVVSVLKAQNSFVLSQLFRMQLSGSGPRQPTQSKRRNRSEKVQRAALFQGGRRYSRSEERPKGVVNEPAGHQ